MALLDLLVVVEFLQPNEDFLKVNPLEGYFAYPLEILYAFETKLVSFILYFMLKYKVWIIFSSNVIRVVSLICYLSTVLICLGNSRPNGDFQIIDISLPKRDCLCSFILFLGFPTGFSWKRILLRLFPIHWESKYSVTFFVKYFSNSWWVCLFSFWFLFLFACVQFGFLAPHIFKFTFVKTFSLFFFPDLF